jgi:hypothetical protein
MNFRLQEELDKQTDVRTKGMSGFYSNLLTKNIAFGGDVEENAISSYTIGGNRSERLVTTATAAQPVSSTTSSMMVERDQPSVDSEHHPDPSSSSTSTSILGKRSAEESEEVVKEAFARSSEPVPDNDRSAVSNPSVTIDKAETIQSARERYLARKQQSSSSN